MALPLELMPSCSTTVTVTDTDPPGQKWKNAQASKATSKMLLSPGVTCCVEEITSHSAQPILK